MKLGVPNLLTPRLATQTRDMLHILWDRLQFLNPPTPKILIPKISYTLPFKVLHKLIFTTAANFTPPTYQIFTQSKYSKISLSLNSTSRSSNKVVIIRQSLSPFFLINIDHNRKLMDLLLTVKTITYLAMSSSAFIT